MTNKVSATHTIFYNLINEPYIPHRYNEKTGLYVTRMNTAKTIIMLDATKLRADNYDTTECVCSFIIISTV